MGRRSWVTVPYMRTVKTTSGATAVQVVWSSRRGSRQIEHLGSAHDEAELEALKAAAQQRIAAGQLPITSSRMSHLVDSLERAYRVLGLEDAASGDDVFRHLVLARIIEPSSKLDSLRILEEAGVAPGSYRTLKRRLPVYAEEAWRQGLSEACAAHARLGPASLVLYDVSALYFETDQGDGFREPGFSMSRCMKARAFGMSIATRQRAEPAANSRLASISTACGVVRSLIPARTAPLPMTSTSPPSMVAGAASAPWYQMSKPAAANIGCQR